MTMTAPSTITFARELLQQANSFLEQMLQDVTPKMAHWQPPGKALPIGAHYAHVLIGADGFVNGLLAGRAPLFATSWAGRAGVRELPPAAGGLPGPWDTWARTARVELPVLRQYARAVYQSCDDYLASLHDGELGRLIDLSSAGLGQQTLGWALGAGVSGHIWAHLGEISCLKGLQGAAGYPV